MRAPTGVSGLVAAAIVGQQEVRDASDRARTAYFDLLHRLQRAVRAVILAMQVSNTCVRCSDKLCVQLFQMIRRCLLAGCRRFAGADPSANDLLLLLIIPEFLGSFCSDLDFIAFLCSSHNAASFARSFFADAARTAHFYFDNAIMRDEELHLAFVSSLLALEPVTIHPDNPLLAQQCLSASLDDVTIAPVQWSRARTASGRGELAALGLGDGGSRAAALSPDSGPPACDIAPLACAFGEEKLFSSWLQVPKSRTDAKGGAGAGAAVASKLEVLDTPVLPDEGTTTQGPPMEGLVGDAGVADDPDVPAATSGCPPRSPRPELDHVDALLNPLLGVKPPVILDGVDDETDAVEICEAEGRSGSGAVDGDGDGDAALGGAAPLGARDFVAPVSDAFGLDAGAIQVGVLPAEEFVIGFRDLGLPASARASSGGGAGASALSRSVLLARMARCAAGGRFARQPSGRVPLGPLLRSVRETVHESPQEAFGADASESAAASSAAAHDSGDEAIDAVASLERLWESARKDGVRRLLRTAGGAQAEGGAGLSAAVTDAGASSRGSPTSSAAGTPRGRHATVRSASINGGGGGGGGSAAWSDSESEHSSGPSVSSAATAPWPPPSRGHGGAREDGVACPAPFGVHLEWRLTLKPRLPQAAQLSAQRGCCPGCKERLTATLFNAPRYCHYVGCYFCPHCHNGDLRVIPARVTERWDFEPRKVCRMAAEFLDAQVNLPLVPITRVRRTKVSSQSALTEMHALRQKLMRILQVLSESTCEFHETLTAILSAQLPTYMVRGVDLYTMQDLIRLAIESRSYPPFGRLTRLATMGAEHVRVCARCQSGARYCAICASPRPVYVFEVGAYSTCEGCQAVFHAACFARAGSECPMCLRPRDGLRRPSLSPVRPR